MENYPAEPEKDGFIGWACLVGSIITIALSLCWTLYMSGGIRF